MDGFGLAVLGLPVAAALGLRVVTEYLEDESTEDIVNKCMVVDSTTSGTAVDLLASTCENADNLMLISSGTSVRNVTINEIAESNVTISGIVEEVQDSSNETTVDLPMTGGTSDGPVTSTSEIFDNTETVMDILTIRRTADDVQASNSGSAIDVLTKFDIADNVQSSTIGTAVNILTSTIVAAADVLTKCRNATNVQISPSGTAVDAEISTSGIVDVLTSTDETSRDVSTKCGNFANQTSTSKTDDDALTTTSGSPRDASRKVGNDASVQPSNSGTAVDVLTSTNGAGAVVLRECENSANVQTSDIETAVVHASSSGTDVDVMKSNSGTDVDMLPWRSGEIACNNLLCEGDHLAADDDEIELEKSCGSKELPLLMKVKRNVGYDHEVQYESQSDDSGNNESDEESTSSDMFFSLINCSDVTELMRCNHQRNRIPPSSLMDSCEINCNLKSSIILSKKDYYVNDRTNLQVNSSAEPCTQTANSSYCLHNINDCPRNKVILVDSLKIHELGQSERQDLSTQGQSTLHNDIENIHSVFEQESEHSHSNPLLSASSGNNRLVSSTEKTKQSGNKQIQAGYNTNRLCMPVESNTNKKEQLIASTNTEDYYKSIKGSSIAEEPSIDATSAGLSELATDSVLEQTSDDTDNQTPELHEDSDMKIITDSSTLIEMPETPKSPTRQYTVECPVIEPTSPKGKACMRKMSLEISFVDPPAPTSPDGRDGTDSRRQSTAEHNDQETLKRISECASKLTNDSRITAESRQQRRENIATSAAAPSSHPQGRFMYQFAVPRAHVRTVIGEKARVIRRLRLRTGATISINYPRGFDGCTCTIEGTYSKVLGAVLILRQNFPLLDWSQEEPTGQT